MPIPAARGVWGHVPLTAHDGYMSPHSATSASGVSPIRLLLGGLALAIALKAIDRAGGCQRQEGKLLNVLAACCTLQIKGSYVVHRPWGHRSPLLFARAATRGSSIDST